MRDFLAVPSSKFYSPLLLDCSQSRGISKYKSPSGTGKRGRGGTTKTKREGAKGGRGGKKKSAYAAADDY